MRYTVEIKTIATDRNSKFKSKFVVDAANKLAIDSCLLYGGLYVAFTDVDRVAHWIPRADIYYVSVTELSE